MEITFQIITSARDRHQLYRFRKQVFVDEENRWETDQDHITDLYDSLDETVNLAAVQEGRIIAAMRVTLDSEAGFPPDRHWDSSALRQDRPGKFASFGWLCCGREFRGSKGVIKALIAKGADQAAKMGATHYASVIHPPCWTCWGRVSGPGRRERCLQTLSSRWKWFRSPAASMRFCHGILTWLKRTGSWC
jgi:predicted GNAT family N-acyltransferase